jgi:starch synthase
MRIAILASEGAPYVKSGGLGDVMEALPSALARIPGNEVVLILPYYHKIKNDPKWKVEQVKYFNVQLGWREQYCGVMKLEGRTDGVQVLFIDNDYLILPVSIPFIDQLFQKNNGIILCPIINKNKLYIIICLS